MVKKLFLLVGLINLLGSCAGEYHFAERSVRIIELLVPRYSKVGDDVVLKCRFRLGGIQHNLYTVNWWRGKDQFYAFRNSKFNPKTSFEFKGLNVQMENCTKDQVMLRGVSESSSGLFKCEVMGEGPAFLTAVKTKRMNVITPPEKIEITHKVRKTPPNIYELEDYVRLNCTAFKLKPRPQIIWKINGIEVKRTEVKRYLDLKDDEGRYTSTLGLKFLAVRYFINQRALVSCSVEVHGHIFVEEEELLLRPSAAFHLFASGGWGRSFLWLIVSFIFCFSHSPVI